MKKTFHINNYLNQRTNQSSSRPQEQQHLPQSRSEKPDYYEQYLERYNLQHSESALPVGHSPVKKTITNETSDLSNRPATVRQENHRKDSEETPKSVATQRIFYQRSQVGEKSGSGGNLGMNGSQVSSKSERQWQLQLELNINKLKDIRSYLQNEIGLLQQLLDETSRNLPNIDLQFEKIKERVLDYTSRSLDTAFRKYKQQMVRWSRYEQVEKKGLEVAIEMREYIREGEKVLEELRHGSNILTLTNYLREMGNRVEHYQLTTNQIKKMREECLWKHPTLKEQKVLQFQRVLEELCCF